MHNHISSSASRTFSSLLHRVSVHQKKPLVDSINTSMAIKLLNDLRLPVCRQLIKIFASSQMALTVTDLIKLTRLQQSVISQHLSKLRRHRLVHVEKDGKYHYYSINEDRIIAINRAIDNFFNKQT